VTSSSPAPKPPPRTAAQIEQDLAATRARFLSTLDEISVRTQPEQLSQDVRAVARATVEQQVGRVKDWAGLPTPEDPDRTLNPVVVGALAGAGVAVLLLVARAALRH
jgi:Protein of unknown function (DUF3618)